MKSANEMMQESSFPHKRIAAFCSLEALAHNLETLRSLLPDKMQLCAVVKADAYGHGFAGLSEVFERFANQYAVASVEEGEALRRCGIKKPVLVLGAVHPDLYPRLLSASLAASVSSLSEGAALSALIKGRSLGEQAHIHIAVDTGMSRLGLPAGNEGLLQLQKICALPGLSVDGIFTHFAAADEAEPVKTERQLSLFQSFLDAASLSGARTGLRHCANSAAILNGMGLSGFDMARAGIAMYGYSPSDEVHPSIPLKPVLSLRAYLTQIREIEAGTEVSYGGAFRAEKRMRIGTVSCGYADGYPRSLSAKGDVLIRGKRCRILGRVCMDQLMVDLSDAPDAQQFDAVTLLGRDGTEEISLSELSERSGMLHYELLCGIAKRVPRVYI